MSEASLASIAMIAYAALPRPISFSESYAASVTAPVVRNTSSRYPRWVEASAPQLTANRTVLGSTIGRHDDVVLVAVMDGEAVGYLWAQDLSRPENPFTEHVRTLYVHHVVLDPTTGGVGHALFGSVNQVARERDITGSVSTQLPGGGSRPPGRGLRSVRRTGTGRRIA